MASASPACAGAGSADDSCAGRGSPTRTFALGTPSPCHAEPGFHTRSQRSKAAISLDKELMDMYGNRKTEYRTVIVRRRLRPESGRMVIRPYGRRKRAAQPCHPGLRSGAPHDTACSTCTIGAGPAVGSRRYGGLQRTREILPNKANCRRDWGPGIRGQRPDARYPTRAPDDSCETKPIRSKCPGMGAGRQGWRRARRPSIVRNKANLHSVQ